MRSNCQRYKTTRRTRALPLIEPPFSLRLDSFAKIPNQSLLHSSVFRHPKIFDLLAFTPKGCPDSVGPGWQLDIEPRTVCRERNKLGTLGVRYHHGRIGDERTFLLRENELDVIALSALFHDRALIAADTTEQIREPLGGFAFSNHESRRNFRGRTVGPPQRVGSNDNAKSIPTAQ